MSFQGYVHNGVVVFDLPVSLPEGTMVRVEPMVTAIGAGGGDWNAAMKAARELQDYNHDAWHEQREYDLHHAGDHLP